MSGGLSILMPVFNERGTVEAAIEDALTAELPVASRQIVVVDDGSTDGTRELLASATFPDTVTVLYHERNLGKGAAVREAIFAHGNRAEPGGHATRYHGRWAARCNLELGRRCRFTW